MTPCKRTWRIAGDHLEVAVTRHLGKPAGDLYVVLQIALPPAESEAARQFYRTMQQELAFNPRSGLGV